eukprot:NODE_4761_length_629_cov_56.651724_g4096_i0.p2 GENE.NODE_4761_length_629_cov_56.651724_g4096_i0~~NODE_4761_length_629_cov_56.651724_g4096_i0.p2  ORF type:complete len:98 (+),score=21.51 NODE_4761_length_629_cov_56.651724_g4096_i0:34-327(+)
MKLAILGFAAAATAAALKKTTNPILHKALALNVDIEDFQTVEEVKYFVKLAFGMMDSNEDGFITFRELRASQGSSANGNDAFETMQDLDEDEDGKLG